MAFKIDLTGLSEEQAARKLHGALCAIAAQGGMEADVEVSLQSPAEAEGYWRVLWESGPREWGIALSLGENTFFCENVEFGAEPSDLVEDEELAMADFKVVQATTWYLEPYYSFDVQFIPLPDLPDADFSDATQSATRASRFLEYELLQRYRDDPGSLHTIDRREFEKLVAEILHLKGYEVELTQQTRDGGRDIIAVKTVDDIATIKLLIDCKRPNAGNAVSVGVVRQLMGVKHSERATKALVVTTERFSPDANSFVEKNEWELENRDYADLVRWLRDID